VANSRHQLATHNDVLASVAAVTARVDVPNLTETATRREIAFRS